jgi:hypothetical protein
MYNSITMYLLNKTNFTIIINNKYKPFVALFPLVAQRMYTDKSGKKIEDSLSLK